jgi:CHAT domain-containing protein/Tfp pilus assembly protein PilF
LALIFFFLNRLSSRRLTDFYRTLTIKHQEVNMFARFSLSTTLAAHLSPTCRRVIWLLAFFITAAGQMRTARTSAQNADAAQTQTKAEAIPTLEVGKPIERELASGQSHTYQMSLVAEQYLNVVVEQRGIDVVVILSGPDGNKLVEVDSPNGTDGPEPVKWVAENAGRHRLEVRSLEKDAKSGKYEVKLVELRAATSRDRNLAEADKLGNEAESLRQKNQYDQAIPLAERALAIRKKALGAEHLDVAISLNNLALLYEDKGDYAQAEPLYRQALDIREKVLGTEHLDTAESFNNLAAFYDAKGVYAQAEPLYRRTLAICEKVLGAEHPHTATTLNNLAVLYYKQGNYAQAESLLRRALTIREKVLGAEHPDTATPLNNLALLYKDKGNYAQAEMLYHRALAICENSLGPEHPYTAATLNNLAASYKDKGNYTQAETLYRRALTIREKILGAEHPATAGSLGNLAQLYYAKGDYAQAEALYRRALAINEKALGAEHPSTATALNDLADIYNTKSDYAQAETLYRRALAISEKTLGADHPDTATALNNLAAICNIKGENMQAELLFQRALAIYEKMLGAEHPNTAASLNNLAAIYKDKGNYSQAEPLFQRALAIYEKMLGPEHPNAAMSLNNLAKLYEATGDILQALNFRLRAQVIEEHNISINLAIGSERQKLAYLKTLVNETIHSIVLHVHFAPADKKARDLAINAVLQRKGRVLEAVNDSTEAIRRRSSPQDRALFDHLKDERAQLARLVLGGPPQRVLPEVHQQTISRLEESVEKLEADISSRSAEFRIQSQPVTIAAVQAAIPADAALLEFYRYEYKKESRYVAYVLRQLGEAQWVNLGEAAEIEQTIDKLRQALRDAKRQDIKSLARDVEQKVMRPIRALIGDTRRLLISPDGALNLIPFAALVDENGQYLVNRYSFSYLTSGRDLLRLQVKQESSPEAIVLADPDFGEGLKAVAAARRDIKSIATSAQSANPPASQNSPFSEAFFTSLPGTAGEALALKAFLPSARVLTRAQATETALKQVSRPRLLHIATHGFFLQDVGQPAGGKEQDQQKAAANDGRVENPYLRSGLALAGANLHKSGNDDGILTALETAGLDLWGTKLVVLSACNSGVGDVRNGDGVYGLRRSLVLAGSESQVMSLWKVSDQGTKELMVEYYKRLLRGEGRGEALRQVQLQMLKTPARRHPFYWASFIQSGEWANLDGKR